jgi:predicted phosphodiesterase
MIFLDDLGRGPMADRITFLHLSDIHFRRVRPAILDPDLDLRGALEEDVASLLSVVGPFSAVIITGDVACFGTRGEYEVALDWLGLLCELLNLQATDVLVVPGNHDVDWKRFNPASTNFRAQLRGCDVGAIDELFRAWLGSAGSAAAVLEPLSEYNWFAGHFDCDLGFDRPFWEMPLPFFAGRDLRVRGLTSVFASDSNDAEGNLVLGEIQTLMRRPRTVWLTLGHHPPSWLRDGELIDRQLSARAHIQLFGHTHVLGIGGETPLRVVGGALHPERTESWDPRYNILRLGPGDTDDAFTVEAWTRAYDKDRQAFWPDDPHDSFVSKQVPYDLRSVGVSADATESDVNEGSPDVIEAAPIAPSSPPVEGVRDLIYRFASLPDPRRAALVVELALLPDDRDVRDIRARHEMLARASEQGRLGELWDAITSLLGDDAPNPFPLESRS